MTSARLYLEPANWTVNPGTACWEWQGYLDLNGYGKGFDPTQPSGKRFDWIHRVAYRSVRGEIPDRWEIDHTCENTRCVNPDHLDAVTKAEHARRTFQRLGKDDLHLAAARLRSLGLTYAEIAEGLGLAARNSAQDAVLAAVRKGLIDPAAVPPARRLDQSDRDDIRLLYALGVPQTELGAWYGVDSSQVSRICSGRTSGHSSTDETAA